ncbi:Mitochondrial dicarboxylate transporter [Purpureocillium takamizusanense]|uniref:Mitochondrial dicarboxylate transporter n=1 Tax=Purpureocillium takamizusanense TaxID=2060973 RepID=A0A9Q8QIL1_9HYPO|nr:Mitochondrial dicarboxylate transporter [Purpureocillium takamizusanense]UNI20310.1 Mitochondrial dicarboxylate transporter [Purpureocillium takamizusanense]
MASSAAPTSASASAPTTTTTTGTANPDVAAKTDERRKKAKPPAIRYPFWFGGSASSMAACVTHPLDLDKTKNMPVGHGSSRSSD